MITKVYLQFFQGIWRSEARVLIWTSLIDLFTFTINQNYCFVFIYIQHSFKIIIKTYTKDVSRTRGVLASTNLVKISFPRPDHSKSRSLGRGRLRKTPKWILMNDKFMLYHSALEMWMVGKKFVSHID